MKKYSFQISGTIFWFIIVLIITLINACGGDDDPTLPPNPTPTSETVSKTYKVGRNDHYGTGWKGGSAVLSANSNNTNKEIKLSKTVTASKPSDVKSKAATFDLDSVTIQWNDITVYKEKNVTLTNTTAVNDVSNKLEQYSHMITITNINMEDSKWYAIKGNDTLREVNAQSGIPSRVNIDFLNNENTTTVNLSGVKPGYPTINIPNIEVQEEFTYNNEVKFDNGTNPNYPFATFRIIDSKSGKLVENLLVEHDGKTIALDSTYVINEPFKDIKLVFKDSDSTWMNLGMYTFNVKFEYNNQVFVGQAYTELKKFYADLTVDVTDTEDNKLSNVIIDVNGVQQGETNTQGRVYLEDISEIPAREDKPWLAKESGTLKYDLYKNGYKDFDEKTVTVKEGNNSFQETLSKEEEKTANATYTFIDKDSKQTIENLLMRLGSQTFAIDDKFRIENLSIGSYGFNVTNSDSTWLLVPTNFLVERNLVEGENNFTVEIPTELKKFYANLSVDIKNQDNAQVA